jgi:hypothetical protein
MLEIETTHANARVRKGRLADWLDRCMKQPWIYSHTGRLRGDVVDFFRRQRFKTSLRPRILKGTEYVYNADPQRACDRRTPVG